MSIVTRTPAIKIRPGLHRIRQLPRWVRALIIAVIALLMAGCGALPGTESPTTPGGAPDALVVIAGVHQGMPEADLPVELQNTVTAAVAAKATVTVIANDGTPKVVFHTAGYPINNASIEARDNTVNAVIRPMLAAIRSARADSNGNNLGGSLALAGDQLAANNAKHGTIIIVDNGLSDVGYPALATPGLLDSNAAEQIVQFAREHHQMLTLPPGTHVSLVGIGYTAAPQQDLTTTQKDNATTAWATYLRAAGAEVALVTVPRSGAGPETTYTTTLVQPGTYAQITVTRNANTVQANLPSDVLFDFGSSNLRQDAATTAALDEAGRFLIGTPGPVTITGYTDSIGDASSNLTLSQSRAASMREWLIHERGIDPNRLTIVGKGEADPAVPNATTPEQNQQNRRVTITVVTNGN